MDSTAPEQDQLAINTIRFLAVDMVEKANSGHPGAPLGQAAMAYWLWSRYLRHDPSDPHWPDRDRFVLSCGHASAMLYALLHLFGYDLPMEELQRFRQLGSKTPGHPEHELTPGVETTTGPLGQGISTAVGMAMAREIAGAQFNRPDFPILSHRIWVIASDGDLMEGIASEACSLAGHLRLAALKVFYDDNHISIDGPTSLSFSEDVGKRFEAYGWRVLRVADGNDLAQLDAAMREAAAETTRPTIVVTRTHIGFGSPKQDTSSVHGEPLGAAALAATKERLSWPLAPTFLVPDGVRPVFAAASTRGRALHGEWRELFDRYRSAHREAADDFAARLAGRLPADWDKALPRFEAGQQIATREASGRVLAALSASLPQLVGGSADLTPSNKTQPKGEPDFSATNRAGRHLRFGVREHAMGAALNGMALSKLLRPYGGTFLIFSDYMRPAIRIAAIMGQPSIFVFTHDSIFLGEDGPTHQPIGQLLSLRAIPGLTLLRPADAVETVEAWRFAIENSTRPVALALTRQNLPVMAETLERAAAGVRRGGYVLADPPQGTPVAILLATGSEVPLALEAHRALLADGVLTRVVSLPSWDLFDAQDAAYRSAVLPPALRVRLAIEAATTMGWERYVGDHGAVLGLTSYGASAPAGDLAQHFGFTRDEVARRLNELLAGSRKGSAGHAS
jgi:transketolase